MAHSINKAMKSTVRLLHTTQGCLKRFAVRKPVRVLNVPTIENIIPPVQGIIPPVHAKLTSKDVALAHETTDGSTAPAIIKKPMDNTVPYVKLHKNDQRFTSTMYLVKSRKQREKIGKVLLEGKRLINDAIDAGMQLKTLYFSREKDLTDIRFKNLEKVEVLKVLYQTLKVWSDLKTCPGVMGVFNRPSAEDINIMSQPTIPVTILCDNIREPGNLGSIIRNAACAGCENILLTKGCVDPWELKVLRTGCGGHFRIPIVNDIEWTQISNYIPSSATILIADNSPNVESVDLNTDMIYFDEPEKEEAEEMKYVTYNEDNQLIHVDETFSSNEELEKFENTPLPCYFYSHVKYPKKNIVLYIGGETHGVDPKIVKLACAYGGKIIKIPMENDMNSLNSAFALTIILYEIKRNFLNSHIAK